MYKHPVDDIPNDEDKNPTPLQEEDIYDIARSIRSRITTQYANGDIDIEGEENSHKKHNKKSKLDFSKNQKEKAPKKEDDYELGRFHIKKAQKPLDSVQKAVDEKLSLFSPDKAENEIESKDENSSSESSIAPPMPLVKPIKEIGVEKILSHKKAEKKAEKETENEDNKEQQNVEKGSLKDKLNSKLALVKEKKEAKKKSIIVYKSILTGLNEAIGHEKEVAEKENNKLELNSKESLDSKEEITTEAKSENDISNQIDEQIQKDIEQEENKTPLEQESEIIEQEIESRTQKQSAISRFKEKIRDGELFSSISWTNVRNVLSFKSTKLRIALPIVIVLLLSIGIGTLCHEITYSNKKIREFSSVAGQVCSEKLAEYGFCSYERLNEKYGKDVNKLVGISFVRELDFDNDGVSELLIAYNDGGVYFNEVYGYDKHKEFVSLYKKPVCTVEDLTHGDFITLYRNNNKYLIGANAEYEEGKEPEREEGSNVQGIDLYALSGNSFKKKSTYDYDYVNEAYSKKGKVNLNDFEKIDLSCIKYAESERRVAQTIKIMNSFDTNGVRLEAPNNSEYQMRQAYYKLVTDYNARYGSAKLVEEDKKAFLTGLAVVKLVDFDGDSIDELMLIYNKDINKRATDKKGNYISIAKNKYLCEIYKWTGQKAIRVYRNDCISTKSANSPDTFYIIKKNGDDSYYCENTNESSEKGKVVISTAKQYSMKDISFDNDYELVKELRWGQNYHYYNGKRINKNRFDELKQDTVLFATDSDAYDIKTYSVGYVKRSADNKQSVNTQLNSTIEEIQKLNKYYVHE